MRYTLENIIFMSLSTPFFKLSYPLLLARYVFTHNTKYNHYASYRQHPSVQSSTHPFQHPSFPQISLPRSQRSLHGARIPVAYIAPPQILAVRPRRPASPLRRRFYAQKIMLPRVAARQLLVAPDPLEQQPVRRGGAVVRGEGVGRVVVGERVCVQGRVPQRALRRVVRQEACAGEIDAGDCVVVLLFETSDFVSDLLCLSGGCSNGRKRMMRLLTPSMA